MKRSLLALLCSLLALGLPSARAANPLQSLGSGLKKAGQVLTPWKKPSAPEAPRPTSAKPTKPIAT